MLEWHITQGVYNDMALQADGRREQFLIFERQATNGGTNWEFVWRDFGKSDTFIVGKGHEMFRSLFSAIEAAETLDRNAL